MVTTVHPINSDAGVDPKPVVKASVRNLSFSYGSHKAVKNVSLDIADRQVTAIIGPSGCGKSTLLRCINRMHDLNASAKYEGEILLFPSGVNIVAPSTDAMKIRMQVGMVFQKPNPFPKSIFENVAYGLRVRGTNGSQILAEQVEGALRGAALWEETKDRLHKPAGDLSGGQQQRLCIARALAVQPEILLLDEPTAALDPIATSKIEELFRSLRQKVTIIIVTHNLQQAARASDMTAFMYMGELVEFSATSEMFTHPNQELTERYITGRFG